MAMRWKWLYGRGFALLAGLGVGALVGLAVYWASHLSGAGLFVLCGTAAGGAAALAFLGYSRAVHLTELTISVPHLTDLTFAVTPGNEGVAWRLFVESVTRVSLQPLGEEAGLVREALDSLYTLFTSVRAILLEAAPTRRPTHAQTVEHLAVAMLNQQMRPFMSRWHTRLTAWEAEHPNIPESEWPENAPCRRDLERMRQGLLRYVRGLGELAGVGDLDSLIPETATAAPGSTN